MTQCPKQWLLSNAFYPEIWTNRGYPERLNERTIMGIATHQALETVIKKIKEEKIDQDSKDYLNLLKKLGGLRNILQEEIKKVLKQSKYQGNPRYLRVEKDLHARITKRYLEEYFIQLRTFLSKLNLPKVSDLVPPQKNNLKLKKSQSSVMTEYYAKSKVMGWKGIIDLVIQNNRGATLIDFKTGKEKENHKDQLELYQLIWMTDEKVNQVPIKELIVKYPDKEKYFKPLSDDQIEEKINQYQCEVEELKNIFSSDNLAKPSKHCNYCGVKQLCDDYWDSLKTTKEERERRFGDFEILVLDTSDGQNKDSKILSSNIADTGLIVKIFFQDVGDCFRQLFEVNNKVRILNGYYYDNDEEGMAEDFSIEIQKTTEVFLINA